MLNRKTPVIKPCISRTTHNPLRDCYESLHSQLEEYFSVNRNRTVVKIYVPWILENNENDAKDKLKRLISKLHASKKKHVIYTYNIPKSRCDFSKFYVY